MKKIAVIGSLNMDITVYANRIPEKGETVIGNNLQSTPGGKGANQAVAIAKLGGTVEMFGCVGNDCAGISLIDNLNVEGVRTEYIQRMQNIPTGTAIVTVGEANNTIVVVPGANNCVTSAYFDSIVHQVAAYDIIMLQHEIPAAAVDYIINWCHENEKLVILNPAPGRIVSAEILEKVTFLTPNELEAKFLFGAELRVEQLLVRYPNKLIITQGSKGVSIGKPSGAIHTIPAREAEVVDTTGAGDAFNGAFAYQIALGNEICEAARFANTAASIAIGKCGAQGGLPTLNDIESAQSL